MTNCKHLVIDAIDGRLYYAEIGKASAHEIPERGIIVALTPAGGKSQARTARMKVLLLWAVVRLPEAEALTWLGTPNEGG